MSFTVERLLQRLRDLGAARLAGRHMVAFSGGLDSTVLLHALTELRESEGMSVFAVHVNHGLQPRAAEWEAHCEDVARALGVEFLSRRVAVPDTGRGLEAAARAARYTALQALMQEGDVVLSAHHEEDQAETLLLNLLRGSGPAGLAGIGASQPFGPGRLVRPLLGVSRQAIEHYAGDAGLAWVDDPSNLDPRFDRNYLRHEILPLLQRRWPAAAARLRRSAELAAESAGLQDELAQLDLEPLLGEDSALPRRLDIIGLMRLTPARQRNVLRFAIRHAGLPLPPAARLRQVQRELLSARADARPLVRWDGAELRRYREGLYLMSPLPPPPTALQLSRLPPLRDDGAEVEPGPSLGRLRLAARESIGIDPRIAERGLAVRFREGGEKIRPVHRDGTHSLKKLLQEKGVVPWMRWRLPLLYAGDTLVAVADVAIAADCAREPGFELQWLDKPALF